MIIAWFDNEIGEAAVLSEKWEGDREEEEGVLRAVDGVEVYWRWAKEVGRGCVWFLIWYFLWLICRFIILGSLQYLQLNRVN